MDTVNRIIDRVGVSDILALILVLTSAFLWLTSGDIPESLLSVTLIVVGFFFGDNIRKRSTEETLKALNPDPDPPLVGGTR